MTLPMGTIVARQTVPGGEIEILQADAEVAFSAELLESLAPQFATFNQKTQIITFKGVNKTVRYHIERWEGEPAVIEGSRFAVASRIDDAA